MISVVVPIYNEEELIGLLYDELRKATDVVGGQWEFVFVNDGSRDRSLELLLALREKDPRVVVVELSRNWGHQPAITAGLTVATGDAVVLMDGDLQDPPSIIPELVAAWRGGAEVVVASRRSRSERGVRGTLFPLFYRLLGRLSDYPIPLNAGIFGLLDRKALGVLNALPETNRYFPGLRAWVGFRTAEVFYDRQHRAAGEPKQTLLRLVRYGLDAIFSFSYKPLRLILLSGLTVASFGVLYGAALIVCRIRGAGMFGLPVVDGYTSTIVAILFLGGVQMVSIGILGEYLGRVYDEVKRRPLFLIRQVHTRGGDRL